MTDDEKMALMAQIKRLAAVYDECVTESHDLSRAHRAGGVNPYFNQTLGGLYLEVEYTRPTCVWTPWGYWHFAAAQGGCQTASFLSRLTLREHIAERPVVQYNTVQGTFGPLYAILAIDGAELPEPSLPLVPQQLLDGKDAMVEWERLFGTE